MPTLGIEIGNDLAAIVFDALSGKRSQQRVQRQRRRLIRQVEVIDVHCCPRIILSALNQIIGSQAPVVPYFREERPLYPQHGIA
jgi:hypothetical protein